MCVCVEFKFNLKIEVSLIKVKNELKSVESDVNKGNRSLDINSCGKNRCLMCSVYSSDGGQKVGDRFEKRKKGFKILLR